MADRFNFRAWFDNKIYIVRQIDFDLGGWYEKDGIRSRAIITLAENEDTTESEYIYKPIEEIELMQSTGLVDSNGKEIFEGDIISDNDNEFYEVDFDPTYNLGFVLIQNYKIVGKITAFNSTVKYEVRGNIYENPELLKKEN